ncbi:MAG: ImmA/IrrE family metallo-endopeptidase [Acetobacteraceae bacterium]|nr:ImmA/IrrE family metallo-endopeptidase [Acetobacteraceae bacterium]
MRSPEAVRARQLHTRHGLRPPVDVVGLAACYGLDVEWLRLSDQVAGLLLREGPRYLVVVNSRAPQGRQRFTVAHELGHFFLHSRDQRYFLCTYGLQGRFEREADRFASELLMPAAAVRRLAAAMRVEELLSYFGVSREAMAIRLKELGLEAGAGPAGG